MTEHVIFKMSKNISFTNFMSGRVRGTSNLVEVALLGFLFILDFINALQYKC